MHIIAIAWLFVVVLMAAAEAMDGSLLGALITLVCYGILPLALVLYLLAAPARRRARRAAEQEAAALRDLKPGASGESDGHGAAESPWTGSYTGSSAAPPD